jgi:5-methylcytosine-specific restriction protein A
MPTAPLKPCPEPRCNQLVKSGRCAAHDLKRRHYAQHSRGTSAAQGYGPAWRRLRVAILQRDPICRDASGCGRPSTDVDHIVARKHGGTDDASNLRGLCKSHHSRKTAMQDGRWGRGGSRVSRTGNDERLAATTRALPD